MAEHNDLNECHLLTPPSFGRYWLLSAGLVADRLLLQAYLRRCPLLFSCPPTRPKMGGQAWGKTPLAGRQPMHCFTRASFSRRGIFRGSGFRTRSPRMLTGLPSALSGSRIALRTRTNRLDNPQTGQRRDAGLRVRATATSNGASPVGPEPAAVA